MPTPNALDVAQNLLARCEGALEIERREGALVLTPTRQPSFTVTLYDEGDATMIAAERWHAHYDDPYDAAFCAMWLLTPFYRVVHELRNGVLAAVWIERYEPGGWVGFEPVYYLNPENDLDWDPRQGFAFTRRYVQQQVVEPPTAYASMFENLELAEDGLPPGSQLGVMIVDVDAPLGPSLL